MRNAVSKQPLGASLMGPPSAEMSIDAFGARQLLDDGSTVKKRSDDFLQSTHHMLEPEAPLFKIRLNFGGALVACEHGIAHAFNTALNIRQLTAAGLVRRCIDCEREASDWVKTSFGPEKEVSTPPSTNSPPTLEFKHMLSSPAPGAVRFVLIPIAAAVLDSDSEKRCLVPLTPAWAPDALLGAEFS